MVDWWQVGFEFGAVLAGVVLAFEFDRFRDRRTKTEQAIEFLDLIKKEMAGNHETLKNVSKELKAQPFMPNYGLQLDTWRAFSQRIALIRNPTLIRDIYATYYKFDMYERTMTRYLDLLLHTAKRTEGIAERDSSILKHH